MEVLILSKTKFGKSVCVGGMALENNQYVRLLKPGYWYQYADTPLNIGDVWDIKYNTSDKIREPHNEDVIVLSQRFVRRISNISEFILNKGVPIWRGSIENIFDGTIIWANNGKGYLSANIDNYPNHSIGFWINDKPLSLQIDHYVYRVNNFTIRSFKYKGIPDPLETIPPNTLLRMSLAKWWQQNEELEERCYLQLSGWYD